MTNRFETAPSLESYPKTRLRRLRSHPIIRDMIREHQLSTQDLVMPLFVHHGSNVRNPIAAMPGHYQLSVDNLKDEISELVDLQIPAVLLFGIPEYKNPTGSASCDDKGIIQEAIAEIKDRAPKLLVISDCCFCQYTDHGHCGVVNDKTGWMDVDNDPTLDLLARQAVSHAQAGADIIAPSGMMDGMVAAIREALDSEGYETIPILSYAVKYASALYAPFREAAQGAPKFGDRRSYQMDPANGNEALREAQLDLQEGADMLMVKPGLFYLDILYRLRQRFPGVPLATYQVGGEYAMIKAAIQQGWLTEQTIIEGMLAFKRAGANFIISYFAKDVARWLREVRS